MRVLDHQRQKAEGFSLLNMLNAVKAAYRPDQFTLQYDMVMTWNIVIRKDDRRLSKHSISKAMILGHIRKFYPLLKILGASHCAVCSLARYHR